SRLLSRRRRSVLSWRPQCCGALRNRHSFPTRRSSDLELRGYFRVKDPLETVEARFPGSEILASGGEVAFITPKMPLRRLEDAARSEEHTSELQSRFDLVCRLLLEKKKKKKESDHHGKQ